MKGVQMATRNLIEIVAQNALSFLNEKESGQEESVKTEAAKSSRIHFFNDKEQVTKAFVGFKKASKLSDFLKKIKDSVQVNQIDSTSVVLKGKGLQQAIDIAVSQGAVVDTE